MILQKTDGSLTTLHPSCAMLSACSSTMNAGSAGLLKERDLEMENGFWMLSVAVALSAGIANGAVAGDYFARNPNLGIDPIQKAHTGFLEGDFKKMALGMKEALMAHASDASVQTNVSDLLRRSYKVLAGSGIPVDWHLPDEIKQLSAVVKRIERDSVHHKFKISGHTEVLDLIKQLRVVRYPGDEILNKQAGKGEWEQDHQEGEDVYFSLSTTKSGQPTPEGLYLIDLELSNGKQVSGWFILDDSLNAGDAPKVYSPAFDQIFSTTKPTFRWQDYHSALYQPEERRSLWFGVSRTDPPDYAWNDIWSIWQSPPRLTETTIGLNASGTGVSQLAAGSHVFVIDYQEFKRFGDMQIRRSSTTVRPFSIAP